MSLILDATAGNRTLWPRDPPNTIFLDKETRLAIPPDIIAIWQKLPFRDKVFSLVIFDPPHEKFGRNSVHTNPKGWTNPRIENGRKIGGTFWGSLHPSWPGQFIRAAAEFARVASRLCLKWNDSKYPLERITYLFREHWKPTFTKKHESPRKKHSKTNTFWVTMEPKS